MFIPFAFTGVCTDELRELRQHRERILAEGCRLLVVACDSVYALDAFAREVGWPDPLLSDFWPHGAVAERYGVFLETKGFATRGTFVIDHDGVVRWSVVNPPGLARSSADLLAAVRGL